MPRRFEVLVLGLIAALSLAAAVGTGSASGRASFRAAAVAVPIVWALCLIYIPARFAFAWLYREVVRIAPGRAERRGLAIVLVCALLLTAWELTWGLDANWAPDEILPSQVRELIQRRFAGGWFDKYPVMHYAVMGVPVSAFEIAARLGLLAADSAASQMAQLALMRVVSVLMGLGTLVIAFLCAAELYGSKRAPLACWSLLLTGLFVFYGKVANLDVPSLCWFGLAILGFIRIWNTNRTADYVLLGAAAAAAVATKDQAYASLALLPIGVIAANAQARLSEPRAPLWRRLPAAVMNSRVAIGAAVSVATFGLFHNVMFNARGVVEHFRLLSTLGDLAIVPRTIAGYADLTLLTGELYRFALGWPLTLAALAGVMAAAWRPERRWWLWLLLVPLSFHLTFTFVTLYVNDRYIFGGIFVAALFAGSALGDALDRIRPRPAGRGVVAAVLGPSLLCAVSVNVMMQVDARKGARTWIEARANEGDRIGLIGWYLPAFGPALRPLPLAATREAVMATMPEWLVMNRRFAARFEQDRSPLGRDLLAGLEDGSLGYVELYRRRGAVPFWAILQYDPEFRRSRESTWTNLDKINPEMAVYHRR